MPGGLICVIKDYRYKPIYFIYNHEWGIKNRCIRKHVIPEPVNEYKSSFKFIEQIYNSVDLDCFKKILEFIKINNQIKNTKQNYNFCIKEFNYILKRQFRMHYIDTDINNFYCITKLKLPIIKQNDYLLYSHFPYSNLGRIFNLNGLYDQLQLGLTNCDDIYEIKHDANYYEGLDFLLTKCNILCKLDINQQRIYISYKLKEHFKDIKYKKTHEIYGFTNQEDFLDNNEYYGFIFDDNVTSFWMGIDFLIEEYTNDEIEQIIKDKDCYRWIMGLI